MICVVDRTEKQNQSERKLMSRGRLPGDAVMSGGQMRKGVVLVRDPSTAASSSVEFICTLLGRLPARCWSLATGVCSHPGLQLLDGGGSVQSSQIPKLKIVKNFPKVLPQI